ncbi:MAG: arginine--tRNA ligase [Planctomycetota bacterium]
MDYKRAVAILLAEALGKEPIGVSRTEQEVASQFEVPKDPQMGDLAFPCFSLAQELKKAPRKIAEDLAEAIRGRLDGHEFLAAAEAAGPYLNFRIDRTFQIAALVPAILDGTFLAPRPATSERVMIEYSQPNTHKVFHVGHTRNVALGDALIRLSRWAGDEVVAANYIGDVGTHIAKCLWYFRTRYSGEVPASNRGEFLGRMYSEADRLLHLSTLTSAPHPNVLTAKVLSLEPHPCDGKLRVVRVDAGADGEQTVVCGGTGFEVGDLVAYARVGAKIGKRRVDRIEKGGVASEGMICSEAEISQGEDRSRIYRFERTVAPGVPIIDLFRRPGALPADRTVSEEYEERQAGVREVLVALEQGEPEITALWRETRQWSLDEFDAIYEWLEAPFDHVFFESEVGDEGKRIVLEEFEKGLLTKSDGAIGSDLSAFDLPFFLLLKTDGTGLYSTKDLALAREKFEKFGIQRSVYVVDVSQELHFKQVFRTLELFGYEEAQRCYHLAYGMVVLPDGKMSSRTGNVIAFSELRQSLLQRIREKHLNVLAGEWTEDEIEEVARKVAIATIKYGMLNQDQRKNIVFDLEEWTDMQGNTGPYLMMAYTRTRSILREIGGYELDQVDWSVLTHEREAEVVRSLSRFPEVAQEAARSYQPQLVCIYLYALCKEFSRFYHDCSVKHAESEALRSARAALVDSVGRVIGKGLELLGIRTAERM